MRNIGFVIVFYIVSFLSYGQNNHLELGAEIQAASFSNQGGTFGGALKFAFVQEEEIAFGPSFRYQYIFHKNTYLGTEGSRFTMGGGGFFHYRFLEWFFLGAELELLRNPYTTVDFNKKWALTGFLGGGLSRDFGFVRLNAGILYDVIDGIKDPYTNNPSPLSRDYFLRIQNPKNPNMGKYIPLIYRIAFFFPLNKN